MSEEGSSRSGGPSGEQEPHPTAASVGPFSSPVWASRRTGWGLAAGGGVGLIVIAAMLLAHCGIGLPLWLTGGRQVTLLDYCQAEAARPDFGNELVDRLEKEAARLEDRCPQVAEAPRQPEVAAPSEAPDRDIDERIAREQSDWGALNVALSWNSRDDLDLIVMCPSREVIFYRNRSACGGTLRVDMNVRNSGASLRPVEQISWPDGNIAPGDYHIFVSRHEARDNPAGGTPFTVEVRADEDQVIKRITGEARAKLSRRLSPQHPTYVGSFAPPE